jgi:2-dehydropantoate 2-reductase
MRIAVFGVGGVGGYFGGLLAQAGHEVTFLARGDHLRAIQSEGLRVRSVHGDFHVHPARAVEDPSHASPLDYVIVAVKHYHLAGALPSLQRLASPGVTYVPLLNGVDAHEHLSTAVPRQAVVGGLCSIVSMIEAPGVIRQVSQLRQVTLGELEGGPSERVERLVEAWRSQGVDARQTEDIRAALWAKLVFIASFGGISSLARASAGEIRGVAPLRELFEMAMAEIEAVARGLGIRLENDVVARALHMVDGLEAEATPSMQRDVLAGRPFELEAFSGTVVRKGQEAGVPTPVHRAIYALLLPALERAMAAAPRDRR